jgi:hypothetical protein
LSRTTKQHSRSIARSYWPILPCNTLLRPIEENRRRVSLYVARERAPACTSAEGRWLDLLWAEFPRPVHSGAAIYVDRILKAEKPTDLLVQGIPGCCALACARLSRSSASHSSRKAKRPSQRELRRKSTSLKQSKPIQAWLLPLHWNPQRILPGEREPSKRRSWPPPALGVAALAGFFLAPIRADWSILNRIRKWTQLLLPLRPIGAPHIPYLGPASAGLFIEWPAPEWPHLKSRVARFAS